MNEIPFVINTQGRHGNLAQVNVIFKRGGSRSVFNAQNLKYIFTGQYSVKTWSLKNNI